MSSLPILRWSSLSSEQQRSTLRRPAQSSAAEIHERVAAIIADVRARGDAALLDYTRRFDGATLDHLSVSEDEFANAQRSLNEDQVRALRRAIDNVTRFHEAQLSDPIRVETSPGVICERVFRPIDAV